MIYRDYSDLIRDRYNINLMGKNRPQKYDKITHQQKFKLLSMIFKDGKSVKEVTIIYIQAASSLKINYSTAKTIMFFYRKHPRLFVEETPKVASLEVGIKGIKEKKENTPTKKVEIISSVGGKVSSNPISLSKTSPPDLNLKI